LAIRSLLTGWGASRRSDDRRSVRTRGRDRSTDRSGSCLAVNFNVARRVAQVGDCEAVIDYQRSRTISEQKPGPIASTRP
jgi:hypothetical protein